MSLTRRELLGVIAGGAGANLIGRLAPAAEPAPADAARDGSTAGGARRPNIAIIVLDDVGYADFGCYGSEVSTPAIDRLAREGLRYTDFHVTALCTPTRACLLTGRNAHLAGAGTIAEFGRDVAGYRGWMRPEAGTLAEMLRPHGYATAAVGKWHLSPLAVANASGPFDHWPTGRGFEKWYGFHGPLADHWHPELWENTTFAPGPREPGYHLSVDLTNRAIEYVRNHVTAEPRRPFFLYLAYGACHWPLHVPADVIARYAGRYAAGWDRVREERFARQRRAGLLPEHARLAPRNPGVADWESLTRDERRFAARGQEVYAAFLEHTDAQIGRFVEALRTFGRLDDTLVIVLSDNGATREGGRLGTPDVRRSYFIVPETTEDLLRAIDRFGDDTTYGAYAQGWAQVSNTPLKWYKATTYGGGIRAPLVVRWPNGGVPAGELRRQYHHAIDVVPTVLEILGARAPRELDGLRQLPLQGTSMRYSLAAQESAPTRKEAQHYETGGDRAMWAAGWKAVVKHQKGTPFDADVWELYHTDTDFSELEDLADREPQRLAALQALWAGAAGANDVLPLDERTHEYFAANVQPQRPEYVFYPGMARLDRLSCPDISSYDHDVLVFGDFTAGASGVILAFGSSLAGYELTLHEGTLTYHYMFSPTERTTIRAEGPIAGGARRLELRMRRRDERDPLRGAEVTLLDDGRKIATGSIPRLWRLYASAAGMRCGMNRGAPVSRQYEGLFRLDGLERVVFRLHMPNR